MGDTFERKDNTATLWTNDYKKEDNHPDFKGDLKIGNKDYKISGWNNETSSGKSYIGITAMSLEEHEKMVAKMKEKNENEETPQPDTEEDSDLPF